jgi:hypothetical protein
MGWSYSPRVRVLLGTIVLLLTDRCMRAKYTDRPRCGNFPCAISKGTERSAGCMSFCGTRHTQEGMHGIWMHHLPNIYMCQWQAHGLVGHRCSGALCMRAFAGRVVVVVDPAHVQSASTTSALQIQKAIDSMVCGFTDRSVCDCACAAHTDTAERESDGRGQRRRAKLKRPAAAFPPMQYMQR